jgi:serine/threonine-protein kinase
MAMGRTQVMGANQPGATQVHRAATGYDLPPVQYDEGPRGGGDGRKVALWVLLALLFIGGAAAIGFALSGHGGGGGAEQVKVPNVVGQTQEDATKAITDSQLVVGEVTQEFDDSVKSGLVISSNPSADEEVDKGSNVDLVVSKGKEKVQVDVPDVTGLSAGQAESQLKDAGFKVARRVQSNAQVPKGTVIKTVPEGGDKAEQGSTVVMYVSSGQQTVKVPNLVGVTEQDAKRQLKALGLRWNVVRGAPEGDIPAGSVYQTSPEEGREVPPGTTVTLFVAQQQSPPTSPPGSFPGFPGGGGGGG